MFRHPHTGQKYMSHLPCAESNKMQQRLFKFAITIIILFVFILSERYYFNNMPIIVLGDVCSTVYEQVSDVQFFTLIQVKATIVIVMFLS